MKPRATGTQSRISQREKFAYASDTGLVYLQLMVAGAVTEDVEDYFDHLKLTYKPGFVGKNKVFLGL